MSTAAIIDLTALGAAFLLGLFGAWRGLIKSIAGIVILVVAITGAFWVSGHYTDRAVEWMSPKVEEFLNNRLSHAAEGLATEAASDMGVSLAEAKNESKETMTELALEELPPEVLSKLPEHMGIPAELQEMLMERFQSLSGRLGSAAGSTVRDTLESAMREAVRSLLPEFARRALFVLSFLLITIFLKTIVSALDKLLKAVPVIGQVDRMGGFLLGLLEGFLLICALVWVIKGMGYFTVPPFSETQALRILSTILP